MNDAVNAEYEQPTYGGIGRAAYFGISVLISLVSGFLGSVHEFAGAALIPLFLVNVALRYRNIGDSGWWCLLMLVPLINLWVSIRCLAMPEGYADTGTLDTAGKIVLFLLVGLLVLAILAAVSLPFVLYQH